jgi:hypothetical protein
MPGRLPGRFVFQAADILVFAQREPMSIGSAGNLPGGLYVEQTNTHDYRIIVERLKEKTGKPVVATVIYG